MGCGTMLASLGYWIQWISVVNHLYLAIGTEDVCGRRCPQLDTLPANALLEWSFGDIMTERVLGSRELRTPEFMGTRTSE
jgi:hypothetical protein